MRKLTITGLLLALFALLVWTGPAAACGKDGVKSAGASSCGTIQRADAGAGDCSAACKAACMADKSAGMVSKDEFINAYMTVQKGLLAGCAYSTSQAAQSWRQSVQAIESEDKDGTQLAKLDAVLATWPSDISAQREAFAGLSEWMISYCESHPDLAAGVSVQSSPESGRRWVQTEDVTGNPYTG